jgi:hypothetical protein
MRGAGKQGSLLMAAFAALLLIAAPHAARAQSQGTPFSMTTCQQNQLNSLTKGAQDKTANHAKVFANATMPQVSTVCLKALLALSTSIGAITDVFGLIWKAVAFILSTIIMQVCQAVMSDIKALVRDVQSLLCIPMPHFGALLQLPHFAGGTCAGISLIPNLQIYTGQRAVTSGVWKIWNITPK